MVLLKKNLSKKTYKNWTQFSKKISKNTAVLEWCVAQINSAMNFFPISSRKLDVASACDI